MLRPMHPVKCDRANHAVLLVLCATIGISLAAFGNFLLVGMPGAAKTTTAMALSTDPSIVREVGFGLNSVTETWGRVPFGNFGVIDTAGFAHNPNQNVNSIAMDDTGALKSENGLTEEAVSKKGNVFALLDIGNATRHHPDISALVWVQPCGQRIHEKAIEALTVLKKTFSVLMSNVIVLFSHCEDASCTNCKANQVNAAESFEKLTGVRPVGFIFSEEEKCANPDSTGPCLDKTKLAASFNAYASTLVPKHITFDYEEFKKRVFEQDFDGLSLIVRQQYCQTIAGEIAHLQHLIANDDQNIHVWSQQHAQTFQNSLPAFSPLDAHCAAPNPEVCNMKSTRCGWYRWRYACRDRWDMDWKCRNSQNAAYAACTAQYQALKNQFDHSHATARAQTLATLENHINNARTVIQNRQTEIAQKQPLMNGC